MLGVWVCPEEYRKLGFSWKMDSSKGFRFECRPYPFGPHGILRKATEVNKKISSVLGGKVGNDPGSKPIRVQSGTLGALEPKKIRSDTDHDKTGWFETAYGNTYRPAISGVETHLCSAIVLREEKRAFALCKDPLRIEML